MQGGSQEWVCGPGQLAGMAETRKILAAAAVLEASAPSWALMVLRVHAHLPQCRSHRHLRVAHHAFDLLILGLQHAVDDAVINCDGESGATGHEGQRVHLWGMQRSTGRQAAAAVSRYCLPVKVWCSSECPAAAAFARTRFVGVEVLWPRNVLGNLLLAVPRVLGQQPHLRGGDEAQAAQIQGWASSRKRGAGLWAAPLRAPSPSPSPFAAWQMPARAPPAAPQLP